ncbi:hydrogenase formation protein HypD [Nodularia spumigena]|jgi:hydrogenase expression/formation protein HypD|uniref:Hydrogenase expression/formation protein HypD n=2 Tax=Nodularia spumigena TaxID=70799 RepID=A0A2S0QAH4_NODSP|nr:hydrogenase formation protein HypD [Nodularia spumigena]AVZ31368.1 hydrogenase expression/formation protein HypD [Nodularia spumigena UHCC 0039]MEA5524359.1 hydrogenase formation protein HypD [Nodularia spumigena UHCC 0143]MEA5559206.1 hydrogenase formation protein HypD [Nodularia spumigena CH309]MEA5607675.1 hydrogenase formation protein HypD [Nodularia spumigena UHCC 0060]MEA5614186.1 hydrogenase formation protein HypD [Nodularia spumigena UHCC 0040]
MKYVNEFREPEKAAALRNQITQLSNQLNKPLKLMEVCGGHTHSIFKYGIEDILPPNLELIHGPGCPVCVMPKGRLDDAIAISQNHNVILATFGDTMRVPGSHTNLLQAKAQGADIRMVYSPLDSLQIARDNPDKEIVFFALGFETTAPSTALTILQAAAENITNFSMFSNHVLVIPALQALLDNADLQLDGFIGPGHVSMVIGTEPYQFIAQKYHKPIVIAGFEPLDILQSIWMILQQLVENRCEVENQYNRLVEPAGNLVALQAMNQVFAVRKNFDWRGLGEIPESGLKIRTEYTQFDAENKFIIPNLKVADHKACKCGEILKGVLKPWECKVFGTACTPETPIGSCMVSSEGACAAYYKYGRLSAISKKAQQLATSK